MNVYMYKAELHCEDCGQEIEQKLAWQGIAPENRVDEHTYDSDDYPKGPYADGGGEADTAHHCGTCGVSLGNPVIDSEVSND